jgi:CBS domain containing-hemolysin-like protein
MILLSIYVLVALVFSFLCSIAEAVLLSLTSAHIALLEKDNKPSGALLRTLKKDINKPLAAILTLNTIAHTIGAAGAGAQAQVVFGNTYIAIFSAVLTLLILVFSEIIPKTLGAHYWKPLAPATAYVLKWLIFTLYPFVKLSEKLTMGITKEEKPSSFSREEFAAMADLSVNEGQIKPQESTILKNLLLMSDITVLDILTPRTVIFSLAETSTVEEFFHKHDDVRFSRIPIYTDNESENISGFVLRSDLLLAQSRGNTNTALSNYSRSLPAIIETTSVAKALEEFIKLNAHIMLVIDEHGGVEGLVTLEDLLETLLGIEIIDEGDKNIDMQKVAKRLAKKRQNKAKHIPS